VGIPLFVLSGAGVATSSLAGAESWSNTVLVAVAAVTGALISATVASFILARKFARDQAAIFIESGSYEVWTPKARRYLARFRSDPDYDPKAEDWDKPNAERENYRVDALRAIKDSEEAASQDVISAATEQREKWQETRAKSDGDR
jgi:hypothetical protein